MKQIDLYESIFKRKSIRKFDLTELDNNTLQKISQQIENLTTLYPTIGTEIKIVSPQDVKGLIQVKAPHYIAAFSEVKEGYLSNIGFMLQQLDLFFSVNGIGCCWQGWPKPTRELNLEIRHEFIIVLAFGKPLEKLHRDSLKDFKRKALDEITNIKNLDKFIEPARLAPSPSQPWYFIGDENTIHICCKASGGFISKISRSLDVMEKKLNRIEIGIAACHLWLAGLHFNSKTKFMTMDSKDFKIPQHYLYIISFCIN